MRDIGAAAGEPSMGADPGLAAERVDYEAAVVGESWQIGAREIEARFQQGVLDKSGAGLVRNLIVDRSLAQRYRREPVVAQEQPVFVELGGIGGGNQQRLHRVNGARL